MKFGLFGGAKSAGEGAAGDSQGYSTFIDYVLYAEELGYRKPVRGGAPFHRRQSGFRLAEPAELPCRAHQPDPSRHRGRGAAVAQSGVVGRAGGDARPSVRWPVRLRRRQGLPGFGVRWLCIPKEEATERFEECDGRSSARLGIAAADSRTRASTGITTTSSSSRAPVQQPHPPFWLGAGSPKGFAGPGAKATICCSTRSLRSS